MNELLAVLRSRLEDQHNQHADAMIAGNAESFADYRRLVGVLHGIDLALAEIDDMQLRLGEVEED